MSGVTRGPAGSRIQGRGAWVEHRKADVRQVAGYAASADDTARFLRELRQLRDGAGLGHAELAARAHYPYDSIRAAEVGPSLPDLPVLSAYVRGCGGTTEEWEERWRSLTRTPSLPVSAARHAGALGRGDRRGAHRLGVTGRRQSRPLDHHRGAQPGRRRDGQPNDSTASVTLPDDLPSARRPARARVSEPVIPADARPGFADSEPTRRRAGTPSGCRPPGRCCATRLRWLTRRAAARRLPGLPGLPCLPGLLCPQPVPARRGCRGSTLGTAPWASHPADADASGTSAAAARRLRRRGGTACRPGAQGRRRARCRRSGERRCEPRADDDQGRGARRVLLCVLAVLLAVFA